MCFISFFGMISLWVGWYNADGARHGHLMLYDDANQVEVRYVISLAHHDVSVHGGEGQIPEGELWVKRNAICLSRRLESLGDLGGPTPPFYLFSEHPSEKEDFYFAMLQNQTRLWDSADRPPKHQEFDVKHMVTLIQRLHSSEEQLQTRWINAILGRLFLGLYHTPEWKERVRSKIAKKISRVNKPNFISRISLQKIDLGEGAPLITNPRLKDLTVDGNCVAEADLQYSGNFRVEISATVRIDLGPRFKTREVDIVLAVVLKKLEGHALIRFKPPPSNRFWISFETMPHMVMEIQPIVSSKQITYSLILRTIESKIREIVSESIVLPFWDDVPFFGTLGQPFRGGIWQRPVPETGTEQEIPDESGGQPLTPKIGRGDAPEALKAKDERTMSMPVLSEPAHVKAKPRKGRPPSSDLRHDHSIATGVGRSDSVPLPRAIRSSQTFSLADPVVTSDNASVDKVASEEKGEEKSSATSAMIEISNRSPPASPNRTPSSSPPTGGFMMPDSAVHSREPSIAESIDSVSLPGDSTIQNSASARLENSSFSSLRSSRSSTSSSVATEKPRRTRIETIGSAAGAAKKWGWSVFGKGDPNAEPAPSGTPDHPIGRGHPHPPPGSPLPRPDKFALKRTPPPALPKRKPVPPPLPDRPSTGQQKRPVPPPPLPRRKPVSSHTSVHNDTTTDELLVVEAPRDIESDSPAIPQVDEDATDSGPVESENENETSSRVEHINTETSFADEDAQDGQSLCSVDQTLSSTPDSSEVFPFSDKEEVSTS